MKHGKVKEYYGNGKLKYEGEYLYNDKRKGKLYIKNYLEWGEFLFEKNIQERVIIKKER